MRYQKHRSRLTGHDTVDGSEILHHQRCIKPCKWMDKLPTSTGERRISEPSTVWNDCKYMQLMGSWCWFSRVHGFWHNPHITDFFHQLYNPLSPRVPEFTLLANQGSEQGKGQAPLDDDLVTHPLGRVPNTNHLRWKERNNWDFCIYL